MFSFTLHPNVYSTGEYSGLRQILEYTWIRELNSGNGTLYIISGFSNYNGGARFYKAFAEHTENGGQIVVYLGGSTSQRLSSKQVVEALLECGADVTIINRKRLLHAKCYGKVTEEKSSLVVSSGNFTGPGMSQNIEASVLIDSENIEASNFSWDNLIESISSQNWQYYTPTLAERNAPAWDLLYDETPGQVPIEESEELTLLVLLGHADTARIQGTRGSPASLGSQYFWLSKDSFDFFPPLTIRNNRGYKGTLSCMIELNYVDLGRSYNERVTFEAENNLDFRLGTGKLRYTRIADNGDIAALTRIAQSSYELRILKVGSATHAACDPYLTTFIGHQGKRIGYIENTIFTGII